MQPATLADTTLLIAELLAPVWMEVCMFSLAMACYVAFNGGHPATQAGLGKKRLQSSTPGAAARRLGGQTATVATTPTDRANPHIAALSRKRDRSAEGESQALEKALQEDRLVEALGHYQRLPPNSASLHSAQVLQKLAQVQELEDGLVEKLTEMAGSFDSRSLELAAAEAQRHGLAACRQLFRIAGLASIAKTRRTLEQLVRGHASDPSAMRALVEEITAGGCDSPPPKHSADFLVTLCDAAEATGKVERGRKRSPGAANQKEPHVQAMVAFGKEGNLDKAVGLLNCIREQQAGPSAQVYNGLLEACVLCGDMPAALKHLADARAAGLADAASYTVVMKGHLARGDVGPTQELLEEMTAAGLRPNRVTYHGLLNVMATRGERPNMWRILEQMQKTGHVVNLVTCSILLKAVISPTQAKDLERTVQLLDGTQQPMDELLFASLVEACIRAGNLRLLSERTQDFAAHSGFVMVSAPTYGSMIKAYGQARDVESVWRLWRQMTERQVVPTAITLGCMVEALVMNHRTEEAWQLTKEVWKREDQRALVNTVIYSTILKGFVMAKQHDRVTLLYEEMQQREIPRNTITYNTILNSIARCGLMHRVPELLRDMRHAEPPAEPDIVTYSTIIKGYCQSGEVNKGLELLCQMREEAGLMPDEVMYNSLLDGCAREQRLEDALRLLEGMREARIAPSNYTLSIVIKLLGRARRLAQAFSMVESVSKEYGLRPNIQVYTCLIQACFQSRQVGKALALHDRVVREGLARPDEKTYTALARGCLQAGALEKAILVVRCAYHLDSPGQQGLQLAPGEPQGVEPYCLQGALAEFGRQNPAEARTLEAGVQAACVKPRGCAATGGRWETASRRLGRCPPRPAEGAGRRRRVME